MANSSQIAQNIKELREAHGLTQAQLGDIAGVSDKAVSTWENGKNDPRMGAIEKICDHFHISKSQLLEESKMPTLLDEQKNLYVEELKSASLDELKMLSAFLATMRARAGEPEPHDR